MAIESSRRVLVATMCVAAMVLTAGKPDSGPYKPHIDPANFQTTIDNPYLPLVPGTTHRLIETVGRDTSVNEITVTSDTKVLMGVTCVVVRDQVMENGVLKEDTLDWYAQDKQGNVWYFGEDTKEQGANGKFSPEGSWESGVNGGQPGIIMPAKPAPGAPYRQEYRKGVAEDMGQVIAVHVATTVPGGTYPDCVQTKEWSLLEPGTEKKWYARGVGVVREESGKEVAVLVSVTKP
jgi:hypothetical protein